MNHRGRRFYQDGLRFECQGCGTCCRAIGLKCYVYLPIEDRRRLAAHLGLLTQVFTRRYGVRDGDSFHLKDPQNDCLFLESGRCSVYEARPLQCSTWPFWPENMDAGIWRREVTASCPGVGRGRRYTAEEIEAILERQRLT